MTTNKEIIKSAIFGVAVGDALGVPVEFKSRDHLQRNPVSEMKEYGSHGQPKGTWSDDTSLTLCLLDSLCDGYDLNHMAANFVKWRNAQLWTPHGRVFDIGIATNTAIHNLENGISPYLAGGDSEMDNGNGSLMRILPLLFFSKDKPIHKRFDLVKEVSSLTHRHIRSVIACFIYLEYARFIVLGNSKEDSFSMMQDSVNEFLALNPICSQKEIDVFHRVLGNKVEPFERQNLIDLEEININSSGYVLDSLEASLWCLLTSNSYAETVLKAVNLGGDTDTTGAIAGGLAGLYYGYESIPEIWLKELVRNNDIEHLCNKATQTLL